MHDGADSLGSLSRQRFVLSPGRRLADPGSAILVGPLAGPA